MPTSRPVAQARSGARRAVRRSTAATLAVLLATAGLVGSTPHSAAQAATVCTMGTRVLVGAGSSGDPCLIEDRADLEALRDAVNAGANQAGVHFRQDADIDLSGVTSWVAIGAGSGNSSRFFGHYDGDFHRITGLTIRADGQPTGVQYYGLFGYVRDGSIQRLRLTGVDLDVVLPGATSGSRYAGGLAGYVQSETTGVTTVVSSVSVQGRVRLSYAGDRGVFVGGVIGRGRERASLEDRISFIGEVGGRFAGSSSSSSRTGNFGGIIGRMSQDAALSRGYAQADVVIEATTLDGGGANQADVLAGVLTGSSSGNPSDLEELYAVGTVSITGALGDGEGSAGVVGFIEDDADTFTDIFHIDTLPFAGQTASGFDPEVGLVNIRALPRALPASDMRGAAAELSMVGTGGRWQFQNGLVAPVTAGRWFLALDPAAFPVFSWEVGLPNSIINFQNPDEGATDGPVDGAAASASYVPALDGSLPAVPVAAAQWQHGVTVTTLVPSAPGVNQVRYETDGVRVTMTAAAGSSVARGLIARADGELICEVCADLVVDGVVEVWMFSTPRLVAAHRAAPGECQTFTIPVVAPLDGGGPVSAGAHTLQLALPTAQGMQAVNVGVTVGGPVPASVPAGEGPVPTPAWLLRLALLSVAGALVAVRRQVVEG